MAQHIEAPAQPLIWKPEVHIAQGGGAQPEAAVGLKANLLQGAAQFVLLGKDVGQGCPQPFLPAHHHHLRSAVGAAAPLLPAGHPVAEAIHVAPLHPFAGAALGLGHGFPFHQADA